MSIRAGIFGLTLLTSLSVFAQSQADPNISKLITTGETNLYIECFGTGAPSIVVNAGFGVKVSDGGWEKVIDAVKGKNQICFYDRANVGKSGKHKGDYDLSTIVEQQNTLLAKAGIKPPYLMVGHSYGSYPIKLFNHRYPEKVAGILLVDPSLYGQFKSHISKWNPEKDTYDEETTKWMKRELEPWHGKPNNIESINMRTSSTYIEESKDFGDKPYVLLWRKNAIWTPPEIKPDVWHPAVWERIKQSYKVDLNTMQTQSSNIKTSFAKTNEHFIHKHEPEVVIEEIEYLLKAIDK
jgi:pimeloyl-ACP methyl ester carboxylesterase